VHLVHVFWCISMLDYKYRNYWDCRLFSGQLLQVTKFVGLVPTLTCCFWSIFFQYLVEVKRNDNRPIPDDWICHSKYEESYRLAVDAAYFCHSGPGTWHAINLLRSDRSLKKDLNGRKPCRLIYLSTLIIRKAYLRILLGRGEPSVLFLPRGNSTKTL